MTMQKVVVVVAVLLSIVVCGCVATGGHDKLVSGVNFEMSCEVCTLSADTLQVMVRTNTSTDELVKYAIKLCVGLKIENEIVCSGLIPQFKDMAVAILSYEVSPQVICGFFGYCPPQNTTHYNVTFPKPKPPHVAPKPPSPNAPRSTILHLTDVHYDDLYVAGTYTMCGEPMCCRVANGPGTNATDTAGKWGDYNCDLSPPLLNNLIQHLTTIPQPEFVFWTGDNPPHDLWLQTQASQINSSAVISGMLASIFTKVPVYPSIGNHESLPVNSFPMPPAESWLYSALVKQWQQWLPQDALETLGYYGYYQVKVKTGFRVISLNMNYCNNLNGWLLLNSTDPGNMLSWTISVLQMAEDAGERVYIIGHIPPGVSDCVESWSEMFYQIVERYEDTIIAQFYGHTHNDQFEVFYTQNETPKRPCNVAYVAPSVTTLTDINPSYRIYTIDDASGYIVDSSTYNVDIPTANKNNRADWELEYNATTAYNMSSLFAADWDAVITRFESDTAAFNQYYLYKSSSAMPNICNGTCRTSEICGLKSGMTSLHKQCLAEAGVSLDVLKNQVKLC